MSSVWLTVGEDLLSDEFDIVMLQHHVLISMTVISIVFIAVRNSRQTALGTIHALHLRNTKSVLEGTGTVND